MITKILTIVLMCCALDAATQLPVLNWAKVFASTPSNNTVNTSRSVGIDLQGNVYTAGQFQRSMDFDPGPGVHTLEAVGGHHNIFISKVDSNGNFVWAKKIQTYVEFGWINLSVDNAGNVYLASDLWLAADMDPGPGVFMLTPIGLRDAFVVKWSTDSDFIWAKQFGGPGNTVPQCDMVELDKEGNVIIAGIFNNTVDFDPGPGVFNISSSNNLQAFIVKLTNSGDFMWAKQFGNGHEDYAKSHISDVECDDQGNIISTGAFTRTVDFDPGPGSYFVTGSPGANLDGFICKLDPNGNLIWVKTVGQNGGYNDHLQPTGLAIDAGNNVVTTGFFSGDYDFDPGPGTQVLSSTFFDCFISKLDQQGNLLWAKAIGGGVQDIGHDVAVGADGNVYTIGVFGPSVDFDPGPGDHTVNTPNYGPSALIKLKTNGDFVYAALFQSLQGGVSSFNGMTLDAANNIFITGSLGGVNDFDPGPAVFPLAGSSDNTPFVLKLSRCLNVTRSSLQVSACNSYTLNNQSYSASGTYQQTIANASGCDSIITLNLTINNKFREQAKAICAGTSFFAAGAFQTTSGTYYDTLSTSLGCDSVILTRLTVNPKPLPNLGDDKALCKNTAFTLSPGTFNAYLWQDNSTGASHTARTAGLYWVEVTNNFNCTARDSFRVLQVFDPPANFLKERDSICSYNSLELTALSQFKTFQWSTGASTKSIQVKSPGAYWLKATDDNGCTGNDTITVVPKQCGLGVYIPTAFTPNNDGSNDHFRPGIFGNLLHYRLTLFNRWGNVVFQSTDPKRGWDGKVNGELQPSSVFVWICDYQLEGIERKAEKGSLVLIR